jgi:ERO1-like protein beta
LQGFVLIRFPQIEPTSLVSDACVSYSALEVLNQQLSPALKSITQDTDFFAYYRLNLFSKTCPFWNDANGMCGNIACAVNTLDNEEDIPEIWRAEELGKLEGPKAEHPSRQKQLERGAEPLLGELGDDVGESCVVEYDDECDERDYCVPEDESASAKGDYVSLVDNPERFTGYGGEGAQDVWNAIYKENCFGRTVQEEAPASNFSTWNSFVGQAASDLRSVIKSSDQGADLDLEDECLEKRVFYRVISGMHASISTHLCWDYLDQSTGTWGPNLTCFKERLYQHPERISNLYFNYALLLRAVGKLSTHLESYTFCSGDVAQDRDTKQKVLTLSKAIDNGPRIFDESLMFKDPSTIGLKDDFRHRFRNVSRLMDCVGCDKCRLWGKLQTAGYGTALKILFELEEGEGAFEGEEVDDGEESLLLRRTELVALVNTLDRVSSSMSAIYEFREMMEAKAVEEEQAKLMKVAPLAPKDEDSNTSNEPPGPPKRKTPNKAPADQSLKEIFLEEFELVYKTFRFVISSWIELPRTM